MRKKMKFQKFFLASSDQIYFYVLIPANCRFSWAWITNSNFEHNPQTEWCNPL